MQKFRYLSHTADMAFIGYGSTLRMAISNSALAMLNIMIDLKSASKDRAAEATLRIRETAESPEDLAWFTLQDVLSRVDAKKLNAIRFEVDRIGEKGEKLALEGRIVYKKSKKDYSLLSIKAVTPHDLAVKKQSGIYSIHVVVDV